MFFKCELGLQDQFVPPVKKGSQRQMHLCQFGDNINSMPDNVAREVDVSKHTIYAWKVKYGGMNEFVSEL